MGRWYLLYTALDNVYARDDASVYRLHNPASSSHQVIRGSFWCRFNSFIGKWTDYQLHLSGDMILDSLII